VRNRTATLAVDLVESLFGKSTLMRRPEKGTLPFEKGTLPFSSRSPVGGLRAAR